MTATTAMTMITLTSTVRKGVSSGRHGIFWVPVDKTYFKIARKLKLCEHNLFAKEAYSDKSRERCYCDSANVFVDNEAYREFLHSKFDATTIEMETAAVALVYFQQKIPFIANRSLSDLAGKRFLVGALEKKRVIVVKCGLGMLNAGVSTQLLLTLFDVKGVLHHGIAENGNPKLHIGGVTIPQHCAHTGLWHWQVRPAFDPQKYSGAGKSRRKKWAKILTRPARERAGGPARQNLNPNYVVLGLAPNHTTKPNHPRRDHFLGAFTDPSTFDTIAMKPYLKNRLKSYLDSSLKAKQYYHRLAAFGSRASSSSTAPPEPVNPACHHRAGSGVAL
ncbi:hypothetical protein Fmac_030266 [Flemingia macrophylla]|uniref:Nucleoside phosphorylase domain-containing protein n=1 Tax=Flemingia macrophylla TaxID=520843 RepID=A0ABD1LCQ1_9FABA